MKIKIQYNGAYPNLCRGRLVVTVDDKVWEFPEYCLSSGGYVRFDRDWQEEIGEGCWTVTDWPQGFPEHQKIAVTDAVNSEIPHGCCGGCV